MARCSAITHGGNRCKRIAIDSSEWCHSHHPDRAKARSRAARKGGQRGGRGRPQADLHDLKARLITLGDEVLEGSVDRGKAAVAGQLWNTAITAIRTALKAKEVEEMEERLEALEQLLQRESGRGGYGA